MVRVNGKARANSKGKKSLSGSAEKVSEAWANAVADSSLVPSLFMSIKDHLESSPSRSTGVVASTGSCLDLILSNISGLTYFERLCSCTRILVGYLVSAAQDDEDDPMNESYPSDQTTVVPERLLCWVSSAMCNEVLKHKSSALRKDDVSVAATMLHDCVELLRHYYAKMHQLKNRYLIPRLWFAGNLIGMYMYNGQVTHCQQIVANIAFLFELGSNRGDQVGVFAEYGIPRSVSATVSLGWGRYLAFTNNIPEAFSKLSYFLANSNPDSADPGTIRSIALARELILPFAISMGKLNMEQVRSWSLPDYYRTAIKALRTGNIEAYDALISYPKKGMLSRLLELGTLSAWERIRVYAVRSLVKRVYTLLPSSKRGSLSLKQNHLLSKVIDFASGQGHRHAESSTRLVMSAIHTGVIKGHVSTKDQMLVLSKDSPFPLAIVR